jgi:type IV pilus assembly protein PilX
MPNRKSIKGISLIVVMMMLIVISFTALSAMKSATSGERVTNNIRMQSLAQQYAEAALRYCEAEVAKVDANRVNTLRNANIFNDNGSGSPVNANYPAAGWSQANTWTNAGGGAASSLTAVPAAQIQSGISTFVPTRLPQCVAERSQLPDGSLVTVITARGFSPDYVRKDAASELTENGSVVWLQSTLLL